MAADLSIKAHDRLPIVEATLGFDDGTLVADLTGCTVNFIMRRQDAPTGPAKVNALAELVTPSRGQVRYSWVGTDTDTPGLYNAEWQVTYPDGRKQTFPTLSYHTISVLADLDGV